MSTVRAAAPVFAALALVVAACDSGRVVSDRPPPSVATFTGTWEEGVLSFEIGSGASGALFAEVPVSQDGIPGSGPPDTVELVTVPDAAVVKKACSPTDGLVAQITLRSFHDHEILRNAHVEILAMSQTGREACNSAPPVADLSDKFGLFSYGDLMPGGGASTVTWQLRVPDATRFTFRGRVVAEIENDLTPPATSASPRGGNFSGSVWVRLSCDDGGGSGCHAIRYTTDGSEPGPASPVYDGTAVVLDASATLRWSAIDRAGNAEPARSETYVVGPPPRLGAPLAGAPVNAWTWFDVEGTSCNDGTPTGIGVSPGTGTGLLIYLAGGGACWDYETCYVAQTASTGPFGSWEFAVAIALGLPGSVLERTASNPFRDYSFVVVPYCTGDVHGGDRVATYVDPQGAPRTWHHVGHANLHAILERVGATFPAAQKVVLSGTSAGGFGTLANYDDVRQYWPAARMYAVDDSGPPLQGDAIPAATRSAWYAQWNLGVSLDPFCPTCRDDMSDGLESLAAKYPAERRALLSYTRDPTIAGYFSTTEELFELELRSLAAAVIDPLPSSEWFFVAGRNHGMLQTAAAVSSEGVPLLEWLRRQVEDDPAWASITPP